MKPVPVLIDLVLMILNNSPRALSMNEITYVIYRLNLNLPLTFSRQPLSIHASEVTEAVRHLRDLGLIGYHRGQGKFFGKARAVYGLHLIQQLVNQEPLVLSEDIFKLLKAYEIDDVILPT